ncbi:hypothetical protein EYF80_049628 [Liparis tanakae]|uniref:Uncharacterized protein n=1 Tax=Liparis tanakae TaxID=230148 RepID=A0A4Z2FGZ3_9TELE|nr:hypothetical protein EYF80_049628 [Liparis tanakae]
MENGGEERRVFHLRRLRLGKIPRGNEKRSSSLSAIVAWTPTSTGRRPRMAANAGDGVRARPGEGEGGLSRPRPPARQGGPWQRLRLCSMKSRMSARGKVAWHWPQPPRIPKNIDF